MTTNLFDNYQLPDGESNDKSFKQLPINAVDKLADELVTEYSNPTYRRWYCKVIYDFGPEQVHEWRRRAEEGRVPARLFSKYAKDARTFKGRRNSTNE